MPVFRVRYVPRYRNKAVNSQGLIFYYLAPADSPLEIGVQQTSGLPPLGQTFSIYKIKN
jgi:hypothetical protein